MQIASPRRSAFTLIELLVVISIITLLIALLLPALNTARYQAKVTQCKSILRGIALGQTVYANDHDFFLPVVGVRVTQADLSASSEPRDWGRARDAGGQVRSWDLVDNVKDEPFGSSVPYDLRHTYQEYLGGDLDQVMECPMASEFFTSRDDQALNSYMLYTTSNFRVKTFSFEEVGAYDKLDTSWSPDRDAGEEEPAVRFTMLASDFIYGKYAEFASGDIRLPLSTHPSASGSRADYGEPTNAMVGYRLLPGEQVPLNFANGDGSVKSFTLRSVANPDTTKWVVNDHFAGNEFLLPRGLASY